ncbi:MAG: TetR family transcriptional regulator [Alphaproteobacteria bacterium]|nr:TetR family transcriptional regulator [Alphaproteobacteria bacterium]
MAGKRTSPDREPKDRLIDAALALAAEKAWSRVTLAEIAEKAGLSLAELHRAAPTKTHLLRLWLQRIDAAVLAGPTPDSSEPARDRLFEVLMRRLDALKPGKAALASVVDSVSRDPAQAFCGWPALLRSMSWMLEAAGIDASGLKGALRARGLALVWLASLRTFLTDESEDMAATMATLDRALKRAEPFGRALDGAFNIAPQRAG